MSRVILSDKMLRSPRLVPKEHGKRTEVHDAIVPGLAARIGWTGHISFVLIAKFPGNANGNAVRRSIGAYGAVSLDQARDIAREWHGLLRKGICPQAEEARIRRENQRQKASTFGAVAEQFREGHLSKLVKGADYGRLLDAEFVKRWKDTPIADVTSADIAGAIRHIVKHRGPGSAFNALSLISRLYTWTIGSGLHDVRHSPVDVIQARDVIGQRNHRERVLSDSELSAVWRGAETLGYPFGSIVQGLVLSGCRLNEMAQASFSEVDFTKQILTIPASRTKQSRPHVIPLAPRMLALLQSLPRHRGDFMFSSFQGSMPYSGMTKGKQRLDEASGVTGYVLHDIRRSMRTHLSSLPIDEHIRELCIGHAQKGLHRIYDHYAYVDEKRRAYTLWEQKLATILDPSRKAAKAA